MFALRREVEVEKGHVSYTSSNRFEHDALPLPASDSIQHISPAAKSSPTVWRKRFTLVHLSLAFLGGALFSGVLQFVSNSDLLSSQKTLECRGGSTPSLQLSDLKIRADPSAGATNVQLFPPASPTNGNPSLFPTNVGYAGGTPTGAEPAVAVTAPAYPIHTEVTQLVAPETLGGKGSSKGFDLFKSWSNLTPWYSVGKTAFGLDTSAEAPETCRVIGLHLLHRHGARYPTGSCKH
jgi:hypothetical protein